MGQARYQATLEGMNLPPISLMKLIPTSSILFPPNPLNIEPNKLKPLKLKDCTVCHLLPLAAPSFNDTCIDALIHLPFTTYPYLESDAKASNQ
jgi:hypothetical protein